MNPKRQPPPRPPLPDNMPHWKASASQPTDSEGSLSSSPKYAVAAVPMTDDTLRMNMPEIRVSHDDTEDTMDQSAPVSDEEVSGEESYSDRSGGDGASSTDLDESSEDSVSLFGAGLCTNCDDILFHRSIFHEGEPVTSLVSCERCGLLSTTKFEDDAGTSKSRVNTLKMLQRGDHVAWRRSSGAYWHHGIVEDVDSITGQLLIINYNGEAVKRDGHYASVRREWVSTNLRKKNLYRIDYLPDHCFPPDVVLERAVSRLGEAKYNPFTENCEHFARWCKAGHHRSVQVETLPQRIRDAPEFLRQRISKEKALKAATRAVDRSFNAGKRLLRKGAKGVFGKVGTAVAQKGPDVMDAVDRGCSRLLVGLSKIEGATTKAPAVQSPNITENEDKR